MADPKTPRGRENAPPRRPPVLLLGLLAAVAALPAAAAEDPKPVWHRQFSVRFNETTKLLAWSWQTDGRLLYDADAQAELVQRDNGRGDRYCMSVHPLTDTPCTHVVVGGQRYLVFPELQQCCRCCSAEGGCGILDPRWLDGAEFVRQETVRGRLANTWTIRGLQPNIYQATADDGAVPLELDQLPNDFIAFDPESFELGAPPPSAFDLPAFGDCGARCPLASVCTLLQARAWSAAAWGRLVRRQPGGGSAVAAAAAAARRALGGPVGAVVQRQQQHQQQV